MGSGYALNPTLNLVSLTEFNPTGLYRSTGSCHLAVLGLGTDSVLLFSVRFYFTLHPVCFHHGSCLPTLGVMNLSHARCLEICRLFSADASNPVSHYVSNSTVWVTEKELYFLLNFLIGNLVEIFGCLKLFMLQFFLSINV